MKRTIPPKAIYHFGLRIFHHPPSEVNGEGKGDGEGGSGHELDGWALAEPGEREGVEEGGAGTGGMDAEGGEADGVRYEKMVGRADGCGHIMKHLHTVELEPNSCIHVSF